MPPHIRLRAEILLWRHGWLWLATALILCAAAVCAVLGELASQRETLELAQEVRALEALQTEATRRVVQEMPTLQEDAGAAPDDDKRAHLATALMPKDQATEELRRIYVLAEQEQIVISQAEFRNDTGSGGIERLQVRLPAKAGYVKLRRFLEATLRALPNASLDSLSFARGQVASPQIEAQVHLSLWFSVPEAPDRSVDGGVEVRP